MSHAKWLIKLDALEHIIYLLNIQTRLKYKLVNIDYLRSLKKRDTKFPIAFTESDIHDFLYLDQHEIKVIRSNNITLKYYSVNQVSFKFNTL